MELFGLALDWAEIVALIMAGVALSTAWTARITARATQERLKVDAEASVSDSALDLVKALKTEQTDLRKDIDYMKRDNAQLRTDIVGLNDRIEKLKLENDSLRATVTLLGQQLVSVGERPMFVAPAKTVNGVCKTGGGPVPPKGV